MWPKAISQLIELTPHVVRLLPMADRFFQSKSAEQDAARTAMEQMAEGLRGDLGQVTASHAGLYRQLNDQSEKLSNLGAEVRSVRSTAENVEAHVARLDMLVTRLLKLLGIAYLMLTAVLILLAILVAHVLH
jgi:septal ring factor EnvC (AmiA/AmiB activator)